MSILFELGLPVHLVFYMEICAYHLAQKDLAYGKKTMKSFLWSLELEAYDEAQQG